MSYEVGTSFCYVFMSIVRIGLVGMRKTEEGLTDKFERYVTFGAYHLRPLGVWVRVMGVG